MGDYLKHVLSSGRTILGDTKAPPKAKSAKQPSPLTQQGETDPHKMFVKKAVFDKPKKLDLVKEIERFIAQAEAEL